MKKHFFIIFSITALILAGLTGCGSGSSKTSSAAITVKEESVTLNKGTEWELGGTLTIPDGGKAPYPSVVLVQGSGPQDRDETIYNNKPFKDIADYLTSRGIAVLRYDKRTYTYQTKMASNADFSIEQEIIQDAIAAANLLKADPRMDKNKVFVIGHSEGGMVAPRIDAEGGNFAGIIMMAGSLRNLSDIIIDQLTAAVNALPTDQKATGQNQLNAMIAQFASLKTMSDADAKKMMILGASGYYYKEMDEHPASDYLTKLTKPVLIMQGDKDFQVSVDKDYGGYKTLLAGKANVTFKLYPGLNHLFMLSTTGTADEYKTPSHVDNTALKDISDWIIAH